MKTIPQSMSPVLVLVGPTAIGKTALSLQIAERFDCEIVSVDSMQVYRYMDIGTAKASVAERSRVRHHLIDIADPDEQYDAARFVRDATAAIIDIHLRK
jgi:tRNA dimethylallyltransferase